MNRRTVQKLLVSVMSAAVLTFPAWGPMNAAGANTQGGCDPTQPQTCLPSDAPTVPGNTQVHTACVAAGRQGIGCNLSSSGDRILVGGISLASPIDSPISPLPIPSAPSVTPLPSLPAAPPSHHSDAFVIELRFIDAFGSEGRLIGSCTGTVGCLSSFPTDGIPADTKLGCRLISAPGAATIGCSSVDASGKAPSAVPTTTPSGLPSIHAPEKTPPAYVGQMCVATDGQPCTVVADSKGDDLTVNSIVILGGRGSWIGVGTWTIDVYPTSQCTGTPYFTYGSDYHSNDPLDLHLFGTNNGGGYYGSCVKATATGANSFVALGNLYSKAIR